MLQKLTNILVLPGLMCVASACSSVYDCPDMVEVDDDCIGLAFTLSVQGNSQPTSRALTEGDETTEYDAAFDMENLQVALFNADNTQLVQPISKLWGYALGEYAYQYYGEIKRENVTAGGTYRCVVLANSGDAKFSTTSDDSTAAAATDADATSADATSADATAADTTSATAADTDTDSSSTDGSDADSSAADASSYDMTDFTGLTYDFKALPNAKSEFADNKIPMWGVKQFTISTSDNTQDLGDLSLIRAAAKCRIHLSNDLYERGYRLDQPSALKRYNEKGYIVPANYASVSSSGGSATSSAYASVCNGFYKPLADDDPEKAATSALEFRAEPYSSTNQSYIVYFPEIDNSSDHPKVTLTIKHYAKSADGTLATVSDLVGTYELELKDYSESNSTLMQQFVRNHVYDFEIVGLNSELNDLVVQASGWDNTTTVLEFTETITVKNDHNWVEGTYYSTDKTDGTKTVVLLSDIVLQGTFNLLTPQGATWRAVLADDSNGDAISFLQPEYDDAGNLTYDSDGKIKYKMKTDDEGNEVYDYTNTVSGTIDGDTNTVDTLYIYAIRQDSQNQHTATLNIYVDFNNGYIQKVEELSNWTIVQQM